MSELDIINTKYRTEAIKTLLRNHSPLLSDVLDASGDGMNKNATVDAMDLDEPFETLLRVAWDIWNGTGETEFCKVLESLCTEDFMAFIDSMEKCTELRRKIHGAHISGSEND